MIEIFTAKTVDEAKELAAKRFGKKVSEIKFEVLEEGKKGFLGIGKTDAKVKATYEEAKAPAAEVKTVSTETVKEKPVLAPAPAPAPKKKAAATAETPKPVKETKAETAATVKKAPAAPAPKASDDDEGDEYSIEKFTLIEDESLIHPKVKIARDYITSILRAMGVEAKFGVYQNETGAIINIESDNNGTIIGRRGETLDSIQYLCSIIANKGDKDYFRITIDCFGYRKKRRETLEQLAAKVAKSVLRTGRSQLLEQMNSYERHVIHSAVSKIDGVTSRSVGKEPYRKIIIFSNSPRKGGGKRRDRRNNGSRNSRPRNREPFESRDIDVSTSFEKDYKKPKPEDSIECGLYGKIEF
ncbi:MAG: Jag N-terminal domain-containing protein [Ruminococcus sp.]|nr:Jag N-terminal domain-containing protein [Ruminococcus sp.]